MSVKLSRLIAFVEAHKHYDIARRQHEAFADHFDETQRKLRATWDDLTDSEKTQLNEAFALREEVPS